MQKRLVQRNASQVYLSLVPILTAVAGFGIGHISYKVYLPIWIVNVCLMGIAAWALGGNVIREQDREKKHLAMIGLLLIVPWMFISIFFGLGPPPETPARWVATAGEQQLRYAFLIVSGVLIGFGFAILRDKLKITRGDIFSLLGFVALMIAIPLFVVNMTFWGSFLVEAFRISVESDSGLMPAWYFPVRQQFGLISVVEVALTYLATAAFAASLKSAGWFGKTACMIYVISALTGFLLIVLSAFLPEPFITAGFFISIPAIPFIMPYLIGVNLLRRAGKARSVAIFPEG